jgi:hypothetical protein
MPRIDPPHLPPVPTAMLQRLVRRFPKRKGDGTAGGVPVRPTGSPSLTGGAAGVLEL